LKMQLNVFEKSDSAGTPALTIAGPLKMKTGGSLVFGTAAVPVAKTVAGNFEQGYYTGSAATGTYRGLYKRLYLTGGAGGEAGRFFTTVSSNAPTDTVNGVHCTLNFGASAGNITGLGTAGRFTLTVPNRSLGGTSAALNAEIWADGTSSAVGQIASCLRMDIGGNVTGIGTLQAAATVCAFHFASGLVNATNGVVDTDRTANTAGGAIRIYIDGVGVRYITYGTGS
jgi:hypothetical protein